MCTGLRTVSVRSSVWTGERLRRRLYRIGLWGRDEFGYVLIPNKNSSAQKQKTQKYIRGSRWLPNTTLRVSTHSLDTDRWSRQCAERRPLEIVFTTKTMKRNITNTQTSIIDGWGCFPQVIRLACLRSNTFSCPLALNNYQNIHKNTKINSNLINHLSEVILTVRARLRVVQVEAIHQIWENETKIYPFLAQP